MRKVTGNETGRENLSIILKVAIHEDAGRRQRPGAVVSGHTKQRG